MRTHLFLIDMAASCGQLLNLMGYLNHICIVIRFNIVQQPGMQNGGDGLPSIIFAGQGILVKMLIILEPHLYFNQIMFAYLYILTL